MSGSFVGSPRRAAGWAWLERAWQLDTNRCLCWPYGTNGRAGYPVLSGYYVHRLACEWAHGPCPPGLTASHLCGTRLCVNPRHLVWETMAANVARIDHAHANRGERNGMAKLTVATVVEMPRRYDAGEATTRQLATELGLHITTVCDIARRREWRWL